VHQNELVEAEGEQQEYSQTLTYPGEQSWQEADQQDQDYEDQVDR